MPLEEVRCTSTLKAILRESPLPRGFFQFLDRARVRRKNFFAGISLAMRCEQTRQPFFEVTSDCSLTGTGCDQLEKT
jgi:hypothetical protein